MKCPFCGFMDDKVIDSRVGRDGDIIRRRRECLKCERRFTTYERVEDVLPMVVKKDGRREPFDRSKILLGIKKACEKRPISVQDVEKVVDEIEASFSEASDREIKSTEIGERVMNRLRDLDEVAYVRFASVYRSFKDINEFMSELKDILDQRDTSKE
jgi:transcriptional repressor NrdR